MIDFEFGETATELWDAILPNSGLVAVENPERYGLAPGLVTEKPNSMVYGVSVTHEYHCLVWNFLYMKLHEALALTQRHSK